MACGTCLLPEVAAGALLTLEQDRLHQPLTFIPGHNTKKKMSVNIRAKYTIDKIDLIDAYRTRYLTASEYTFFIPILEIL